MLSDSLSAGGRSASGQQIDNRFLRQFPEFIDFFTSNQANNATVEPPSAKETTSGPERTPEELIEAGYCSQNALASDLLERVKSASPTFFEQLVVRLLVAMGYGGLMEDAGKAVGKSGDEGIDGIIKEDRLGLDVIYLQAKRWEKTIGLPDIQQFAGALQGQRAREGRLHDHLLLQRGRKAVCRAHRNADYPHRRPRAGEADDCVWRRRHAGGRL